MSRYPPEFDESGTKHSHVNSKIFSIIRLHRFEKGNFSIGCDVRGESKKMKTKAFLAILSIVFFLSSISVFSVDFPEIIRIKVQIDNKIASVNGKNVTLDAPPIIIKNKTFVPLRFISDAFGAFIEWDSATLSVSISLDNPTFYRLKTKEQESEMNRLNEVIKTKDQTIKSLNTEINQKDNEIDLLKQENAKLKTEIATLQKEIENLKKVNIGDIEYKNIQLLINGKKISTSLEPCLLKGKVFAALEDICKPLGKTFKWDSIKNIFSIEDAPKDEQPPFEVAEKIGIYTNSFGYHIYVADPIKNRVLKYSTDGIFLDTVIKTITPHVNGEKWELRKVVDVTTCRLTDVVGVADASTGNSYVYELTGHSHHKSGKQGIETGELQELWAIAMTEINENKLQALLDRKGCKVSLWSPPPGGIKDPQDGLWVGEFGVKGYGDGQLMDPEDICFDKNQNLWVADTGNNRVVEFDVNGSFVRNLTENFKEPCSVGMDFLSSQGNKLYVLDRGTKTIHIFSSNRELLKIMKLDDMEKPSSMTIDCDNNIWVTDVVLNKAFKYNQTGNLLLTIDNLIKPDEVKRTIVRVYVGKYIMTINDIIKAYDGPPFMEDDRIYVPVKSISEGLGAETSSTDDEQSLTIQFNQQKVLLHAGDKVALVDDNEVLLDYPPIRKKNRLFITTGDYGKLFPVTISINPRDLRYSASGISFIYPK